MNPALRSSAAHVFVESLAAPELHPDDAHHLVRVLRLRDGEAVTASDGNGGWRPCTLAGGALRAVGEVVQEPLQSAVTIAAAIPKGERLEWMVQKLTEVGVARIVLVECARSVVRWQGERVPRQMERLARVAREASMQSRRVCLPEVVGPVPFTAAVSAPGVVLADPAGAPWAGEGTIVVGPEGGFTAEELADAAATVSLGHTVLRVETAALVAAVLALSAAGASA
jgi:16S rRNA (uracil1498-N3)-methyltransferase